MKDARELKNSNSVHVTFTFFPAVPGGVPSLSCPSHHSSDFQNFKWGFFRQMLESVSGCLPPTSFDSFIEGLLCSAILFPSSMARTAGTSKPLTTTNRITKQSAKKKSSKAGPIQKEASPAPEASTRKLKRRDIQAKGPKLDVNDEAFDEIWKVSKKLMGRPGRFTLLPSGTSGPASSPWASQCMLRIEIVLNIFSDCKCILGLRSGLLS